MVRDGIYYALGLWIAALALGFVWPPLAAVPVLLSLFFLWFFRDPERNIPSGEGVVVSPADGKVTFVSNVETPSGTRGRISIFLNVFSVHVNRSPIAGTIREVQYQKGKFHNAMGSGSSDLNEQNIVTVEGEGHTIVFKQIAGLLARRIVFTKAVGDKVGRGERVGLIKFSSRVDVVLDPNIEIAVKVGDQVAGGSSILGRMRGTAGVRNLQGGRGEHTSTTAD